MDKQEERTVIVADGAYSGTENTQLAADKNVELITTSLTGKPAPNTLAGFEFNEEGTRFEAAHGLSRLPTQGRAVAATLF